MQDLEGKQDGLQENVRSLQELVAQLEMKLPEKEQEESRLIQDAITASGKENYEQAIDQYGEVLKLNPQNYLALTWKGTAYLKDGEYESAIASLRKAVAVNPEFGEAYYTLALSLWQAAETADLPDTSSVRTEAVTQMEEAFELDESLRSRAQKDAVSVAIQRHREYVDVRSTTSGDEAKSLEKALGFAKQGRYDEAIPYYDQAIALNPKNAKVYSWRGYSQYRNEHYRDAIASFEQAIDLDPKLAEAHFNLGLARWKVDQKDAAVAATAHATALNPAFAYDPQGRGIRKYMAHRDKSGPG